MERKKWTNLNGLWKYAITEIGSKEPSEYQGDILVPYPVESSLSGVAQSLFPNQNLWYKRNIVKPQVNHGDKILLHFGAVDWQATVYINDRQVGIHKGGYTAFTFDITDFLDEGINELKVKVYDPTDQGVGPHGKQALNPANIYYTSSSGIWQTVWLETVPENFIEDLVITPDIDESLVRIKVNSQCDAPVTVRVAGKEMIGITNTTLSVPIDDVRLWSPESPYLYDLQITMGSDQVKSYFGMRKISIGKDAKGFDRILLNNKYIYNLGALDQGFWPDGLYTAPNDDALQFDLKTIKAMGFNTVRKHIKVEPARWYYYADKLGVMVWQDLVNPNQGLPAGSKEEFETESREIVKQLYNYPSITVWVLFNEKWGQYDQERLTNWLKAQDPTRLVNGHSGEYLYVNDQLRSPSSNAYVNADITDVHSYPNPRLPERQTGKALVCGEFGGIGVSVPGHQWDDLSSWGYVEVTAKELDSIYDTMVNNLKELEAQGLSASIYTQPFDVEGEENGLMTYDRRVLKIPISRLREIHSQLVGVDSLAYKEDVDAGVVDKEDNDNRYTEFQTQFETGKRDSVFLRRLTLIAMRKRDDISVMKYANAYLNVVRNLFARDNFRFIVTTTRRTESIGFRFLMNNREEINKRFGNDVSERILRRIIGQNELDHLMANKDFEPKWIDISKKLKTRYGDIGVEKYNGARMIWAWEKADWKTFSVSFKKYYSVAHSRSEYNINNMAWSIFEHIADREAINIAISVMENGVKTFASNDFEEIDTYANLLYKAGRVGEAIKWETKAVILSRNRDEIVKTLEKMKKGIPTWEVTKQVK
ncbi:glycoside hydrolase family 2 protein [Pedobacter faecalis]|uniref:glycoside hydrolase family 2 protein n=1 Tax=Pedobacter faecalis TaxID=3041495 RepID=UPI00254A77A7|nr:sugar-binding domain-containing protein [Pedobacter sp. ELA7]